MTYEIDISNAQRLLPVDTEALKAAIVHGLTLEHVRAAVLSVSIVDDKAIHVINRDHLQHDYPTDVISFQLEFNEDFEDDRLDGLSDEAEDEFSEDTDSIDRGNDDDDPSDSQPEVSDELRAQDASIEGEIIVSAETAMNMASDGHWLPQNELTLYVIHGMLHICGYDDLTPDEQAIMRSREKVIMGSLGFTAIYSDESR